MNTGVYINRESQFKRRDGKGSNSGGNEEYEPRLPKKIIFYLLLVGIGIIIFVYNQNHGSITEKFIKWAQHYADVNVYDKPDTTLFEFPQNINTNVNVRFNDGTQAKFDITVRITLPNDKESLENIALLYKTQESLNKDIKKEIRKATYLTAFKYNTNSIYNDPLVKEHLVDNIDSLFKKSIKIRRNKIKSDRIRLNKIMYDPHVLYRMKERRDAAAQELLDKQQIILAEQKAIILQVEAQKKILEKELRAKSQAEKEIAIKQVEKEIAIAIEKAKRAIVEEHMKQSYIDSLKFVIKTLKNDTL